MPQRSSQAKAKSSGKWRVISADHQARTVVMQRGSETATFEMGSMRRVEAGS